VWYYVPAIPALRRLKQNNAEFQGQPGLRKILSLKQNNTTENTDFSENIGQIFY
jgi:hypothetical protein